MNPIKWQHRCQMGPGSCALRDTMPENFETSEVQNEGSMYCITKTNVSISFIFNLSEVTRKSFFDLAFIKINTTKSNPSSNLAESTTTLLPDSSWSLSYKLPVVGICRGMIRTSQPPSESPPNLACIIRKCWLWDLDTVRLQEAFNEWVFFASKLPVIML